METQRAVIKPTKAGNGFKVRLPNGDWLYASRTAMFDMVQGRRDAVSFVPINAMSVQSADAQSANNGAEW